MSDPRTSFSDLTDVSIDLLRRPEVSERWDEPSALPQWSVKGLAGHLVRGSTSVEAYLDRSVDVTEEPVGAAEYYVAAVDDDDLDSALHRAIRRRGDEMAAEGYEALISYVTATRDRLANRLPTEPVDRKVRVFEDIVVRLDDYLITRIVELTVHIDDLAVSIGVPTPALPDEAVALAIQNLVDVARVRHGELAVLRALARRERDRDNALRVL